MSTREEFQRLENQWTKLGEDDPFYSVIGHLWYEDFNEDPQKFYTHGMIEIQRMFRHFIRYQVLPPTGVAMEFGSGLGRITIHLSSIMKAVVGVDVSQKHIDIAKWLVGRQNISWVKSSENLLELFEEGCFSLIFSTLVLQHMRSDMALQYIDQFCLLLKKGGVAYFQIPTSPYIEDITPEDMGVVATQKEMIAKCVRNRGVKIVAAIDSNNNEAGPDFISTYYILRRPVVWG